MVLKLSFCVNIGLINEILVSNAGYRAPNIALAKATPEILLNYHEITGGKEKEKKEILGEFNIKLGNSSGFQELSLRIALLKLEKILKDLALFLF